MESIIQVKQVTKQIESFTLGPVDLSIQPGTVTALIGDNGSGKSTLIKMMMNLIHPTEGEIIAFKQNVTGEKEAWKVKVAYLPQTAFGYDTFKGKHLQHFMIRWYPTFDKILFNQIVRDLNIPLQRTFSKLSQGVQQKLLLALTIARGTKLLILDEPMTFLDIPSKKYFTNVLIDWLEQDDHNRSIILATHQAEDIKRLADYLYLVRGGKPVGLFEKDSLIDRYKRYWINDMNRLPLFDIPCEKERDSYSVVSSNAHKTEIFFKQHHISWNKSTSLDLEEIIALELMMDNTNDQAH